MNERGSWRFGPFELDPVDRRLIRDGTVVALPPKAFDILTALVKNAGRLVKRDDLFQTVWDGIAVEDANLTNNVSVLRRVLGPTAIASVPRHGYRFCLAVSESARLSEQVLDLFLKAQNLLSRRSTESVLRSRDLLWLVIGYEPQFAPAWAWLGRACRFLEKFGVDRDYHRKVVDLGFQRAFAIDPGLACAHQFFTVIQVDRGGALSALHRLLSVVEEKRTDAHFFAALVQVCRFCGLPGASVKAHELARDLDPEIATSVAHTYFARCEYEAVIESYLVSGRGTGIYLDLCAWACLGLTKRAETEALNRLDTREWPPLFKTLLESLLQALQGNAAEVRRMCLSQEVYEDPESLLYLARHLAYCHHFDDALAFLKGAISGGLAIPEMLEQDPWLAGLRRFNDFKQLIDDARRLQSQAELSFYSSPASHILSPSIKGARSHSARHSK